MDVLSSRDETTGRSGLGLLRDDVIRAPYRWLPGGLGDEYQWSQQRAGSSQARTTNSLLRPGRHSGDFLPAPYWDGPPEPGHPPLDPPGAATLRGSGPEQRIGEPEDSPGGATGRDLILQRKHANVPFEGIGPMAGPRIGIV